MTDADIGTDARVELLLNDAHLVIDYAVRVGRLSDDRLLKAVSAVESATPASGQDIKALTTALNTALNNAIMAIAPMTLIDLRGGRNPLDPRNQRSVRSLQAVFCVLTIGFTIFTAHLTDIAHRQDTALKAIQQINETHPLDKLNALRKMVKIDSALEKVDSISYDQYHRSVSELRDLQDRLSGLYTLLTSATQWSWLPGWFTGWINHLSPNSTVDWGWQGYSPSDKAKFQELTKGTYPSAFDACASQSQDGDLSFKKYPLWLQQAIGNAVEEYCFSNKLSLLLSLPPTATFYRIQAEMAGLNGWVLPFLYGLLGGMVFVVRNLLDPRTPIMGLFPSIVRIALGGLAGILIGWFWVPSAFKAGDIATFTSIPFGLAFLAGFSIDILFSILDRLSRTVSEPAPPKTP